jgi:hypothetical protein
MKKFRLAYANEQLSLQCCKPKAHFDNVVASAVQYFLRGLKNGDILDDSEVYCCPTLGHWVYVLRAPSFDLVYSIDADAANVIILELTERDPRQSLNRYRYDELLERAEDQQRFAIPQADNMDKLFDTLDMATKGKLDPLNTGKALRSVAKTDENIARHGLYYLDALVELKILNVQEERKRSVYFLTESAQSLVATRTTDLKLILAKAILAYYPVSAFVMEVQHGGNPCDESTAVNIIDMLMPNAHTPVTMARRARCIIAWAKWATKVLGIELTFQTERQLSLEFSITS